MSAARTKVTLVEWAARARRARQIEMQLADTLGTWVRDVDDPGAKAVLARHARHHAFHADLWNSVVPVLHDVTMSDEPSDDPGLAEVVVALTEAEAAPDGVGRRHQMFVRVLPELVAVYGNWATDTSVVADRPVMRVLDLVLRDDEYDTREGAGLYAP